MGAGHGHGDRPSLGPAPRRLRVLVALLVAPLVLATVAGLVVLWPDGDLQVTGIGTDVERGKAVVTQVGECRNDVDGCRLAQVDLVSGPGAPGEAEAFMPYGPGAPEVAVGRPHRRVLRPAGARGRALRLPGLRPRAAAARR